MPRQRRSGSQFASNEVVTPARRAAPNRSGSPDRSRGWIAVEPACRCRTCGSTRRGTSSARSRSIVPIGGQERAVVASPEHDGGAGRDGRVDRDRRDVDAVVRERIADRPTEEVVADDAAVRDPQPQASGTAGGDRRRAADREPDGPDELLDLAELGHRVVVDHEDVGVDVPDDVEVDVATVGLGSDRSRVTRRRRGTTSGPGSAGCPSGDTERHGRASRSTSSFRRPQPRQALRRRATRPARAGGSVTAPSQTERPTSTPEAPERQATSACSSNVGASTPAERSTHGTDVASSSSAQASCQRAWSVTAGSYGNSAFSTSPPSAVSRRADRITTSRRASPVSGPAASSSENESGSRNRPMSSFAQSSATDISSRSCSAAFGASGW